MGTLLDNTMQTLAKVPGVRGVVVAGRDGLLLRSTLAEAPSEALSALGATAYGTAEGTAQVLAGMASLQQMIIEGTDGSAYLAVAGDYLVMMLAGTQANAGMIQLELRRAADALVAV